MLFSVGAGAGSGFSVAGQGAHSWRWLVLLPFRFMIILFCERYLNLTDGIVAYSIVFMFVVA